LRVATVVVTALAVTVAGRERAHGPGRGQIEGGAETDAAFADRGPRDAVAVSDGGHRVTGVAEAGDERQALDAQSRAVLGKQFADQTAQQMQGVLVGYYIHFRLSESLGRAFIRLDGGCRAKWGVGDIPVTAADGVRHVRGVEAQVRKLVALIGRKRLHPGCVLTGILSIRIALAAAVAVRSVAFHGGSHGRPSFPCASGRWLSSQPITRWGWKRTSWPILMKGRPACRK
jgi:hypothetical protein